MTPPPPAAGPDYPEQRDHRRDLDRGFAAAASVIRSLTRHLGELDTADLPTFDGKSVRIVSLVEVEQWLEGCAVRVTNGEIL